MVLSLGQAQDYQPERLIVGTALNPPLVVEGRQNGDMIQGNMF